MAKKAATAPKKSEKAETKAGLDIKVKLDKTEKGRVTITVTLLQDGVVVASDYDFIQV